MDSLLRHFTSSISCGSATRVYTPLDVHVQDSGSSERGGKSTQRDGQKLKLLMWACYLAAYGGGAMGEIQPFKLTCRRDGALDSGAHTMLGYRSAGSVVVLYKIQRITVRGLAGVLHS